MRQSHHIQSIELQFGRTFREVIRDLTEQGFDNTAKLAEALRVPYPTMRYLLLREGARFHRTVRFPEEQTTS